MDISYATTSLCNRKSSYDTEGASGNVSYEKREGGGGRERKKRLIFCLRNIKIQ